MRITWAQLNRLPVLTESGSKIGIISGVTVNTDSHSVDKYEVITKTFVFGLLSRPILISPSQVISISDKAMVVKDEVIKEEMVQNKKTRLAFESPAAEIELSEAD